MPPPPANLYARLLGAQWDDLSRAVQSAHSTGGEKTGEFQITRGQHFCTKLLAVCARLPPDAMGVETRLSITEANGSQRWERWFTGRRFITSQTAGRDQCLLERAGPLEFSFHLKTCRGALHYHQTKVRLCLGPLRLPLLLAPHVSATETGDGPDRVNVSVTVRLPLFGLLIAYKGWLDTKEVTL